MLVVGTYEIAFNAASTLKQGSGLPSFIAWLWENIFQEHLAHQLHISNINFITNLSCNHQDTSSDNMPAQTTQQSKTSKSTEAQPWRAAWPENDMATKQHVISYGFLKGTKMHVNGSAGHAKMTIVYDTEQ